MSIRCLHEIPFTYLVDIQEKGLGFFVHDVYYLRHWCLKARCAHKVNSI
jgi:hypothetical protein